MELPPILNSASFRGRRFRTNVVRVFDGLARNWSVCAQARALSQAADALMSMLCYADSRRTFRMGSEGMNMLNTATLDELAKKIGQAIDASPAKDVEKNVKALLQASLQRLDLVPREEFELQTQVLLRTREQLETLESRVAQLEARGPRKKHGA